MKGLIITLAFAVFSAVILYEGNLAHFSERVYLTSVVIQVFSLYYIFVKDKRPYSINKMVYIFSFFFYGIAPLIQFNERTSSYSVRLLREEEFFFMNCLILVILILYALFYSYFIKKGIKIKNIGQLRNFEISSLMRMKQAVVLLFVSFTSFFIIYYINGFNLYSMLIRGGGEYKVSSEIQSSALRLVVGHMVRPLSMICLLYFICFKGRKSLLGQSILFILAIITCFPLGMPRFSVAALYLPLLLLMIPMFRRQHVFSLFFIFGLLIVFPFLNNFRYYSQSKELEIGIDYNMFTAGHFDSYQNFALIVNENYLTWGKQLLGVFLFWVPRSFWPDKPIGSGAYIANDMHFSFTNVSANYFAEGYINFGYLGILLFIVILAYFSARMDNLYWNVGVYLKNNFFKVIYFIMMGMCFFVLRGDLLSSFAFTMGFLIAIYLVVRLVRLNGSK